MICPTFQLRVTLNSTPGLAGASNKALELAIVGQNLLHDRHAEFNSTEVYTQATEIPRSVYGTITWQF